MLVNSPVVIEPPTIRRAPNHEMSSMHAYMQNCISGITPAGNKAASLTNASVYLDGRPLNLTAYSIGGNNYFKLRDLGDALGFGVDWNADTMTMILTVK